MMYMPAVSSHVIEPDPVAGFIPHMTYIETMVKK